MSEKDWIYTPRLFCHFCINKPIHKGHWGRDIVIGHYSCRSGDGWLGVSAKCVHPPKKDKYYR